MLNGSGVAVAAGRMSVRLSEAGFVVLPAGNAAGRYGSSAVYFAQGWQDEAERVLSVVDIDGVEAVTAMPPAFADSGAVVVVLLGTDTAPARAQTGLRPRPRNDVALPLSDDIPRDQYVPGLASIQIFSEINDNSEIEEVRGGLNALSRWMNLAGYYSAPGARSNALPLEDGMDYNYLRTQIYPNIERVLEYFGFTPQNTCGAPQGYSFTDLLQPTREFNTEIQSYSGDAIWTTDRLLELHGGVRINPETNLDYYISEAVQTAYDTWRLSELLSETESPQMILCVAWKLASGEIPEFANAYWYALLTPGIRPQESLMSQGTYHVKEISRNGNIVFMYVCHPTIGERSVVLWWREAGYRAEVTGGISNIGCQARFEKYDYVADHEDEPSFAYRFGEMVFSADEMLNFPRAER